MSALGYEAVTLGTGRWNGVAILSRVGISDVSRGLVGQPEFDGAAEPRAIGATCDGVRVWSLYCPNGREPGHDHYNYKLEWFKALNETVSAEMAANPSLPFAAIGDYNIAPTDADVWDIAQFTDSTHVTAAERAALTELEGIGLREVKPRSLKGEPFTFWDYRNGSFHRGWGMRIDLIYGNSAFTSKVTDAYVDRDARKGKGASDHAPVVVDIS
jgi:exodeoxyribonuclease III